MQDKVFKYNFSRGVIYGGLLQILLVSAIGYLLYYLYDGGYISAWFVSVVIAFILLLLISLPRKIVVTSSALRVMCVLEMVEINIDDIVKIRRINPRTTRCIIPLIGSYGLFGYYGHFADIRRAEKVKVYATERANLIEIIDIYEDRYIISCRESAELLSIVRERMK